jgi:hypothetical protein
MNKLVFRLTAPVRKYLQNIKEIEKEKAAEYARGCQETSARLSASITLMNNRLDELTKASLSREKDIQAAYDSKVELLQANQLEKCSNCMATTEAQRERLRKAQNGTLDLMEKLNHIFLRLFQHADLVIDAQDDILRKAGLIKTSREILVGIKKEFDTVKKDGTPLLAIDITEQPIAKTIMPEEKPKGRKKDDDEKIQS